MGQLGKEALKADIVRSLTHGQGRYAPKDWNELLRSQDTLKHVSQLIILEIQELTPEPTAIGFTSPMMGMLGGSIVAMSGFRYHLFYINTQDPQLDCQLSKQDHLILLEDPSLTETQLLLDCLRNFDIVATYGFSRIESVFGKLFRSVL